MRNDFRGTGLECTLASELGVSQNSETVKLDSNWRRRRTIFRNVSWLFLTEWRIAPDNYATKHAWQACQFHLYSKDANFVHVTGSIFFQSLQLVLKNRIFEPKSSRKKQPKYKYSSMESQQPYWVLSVPYFSEQTREFYIFTWQTSVFV